MIHRNSLLTLMFVLVLLAACGTEDLSPRAPLTLVPVPTTIVTGDCNDTHELENWLQVIIFQQQEFLRFFEAATGKSRGELRQEVEELNEFWYAVAAAPAMTCGTELLTQTLTAMENAMVGLQAYVNGDRNDLTTIIQQARAGLETTRPLQTALIQRMEDQYRAQAEITAVATP